MLQYIIICYTMMCVYTYVHVIHTHTCTHTHINTYDKVHLHMYMYVTQDCPGRVVELFSSAQCCVAKTPRYDWLLLCAQHAALHVICYDML